ncbi:MAG: hypothetical protein GF381_03845 [Candidatus Pacebacteria bacterium]|nr:hypothetical protein [Candidatus Paceibacterota bacterium]
MKKYFQLPILLLTGLACLFLAPLARGQVQAAASFSLSPASATLDSSGGVVKVNLDSGGESLESATAVITYDSTKVEVTASSGTFFPIVSTDDSGTNEIVITGNVNFGDQVGKSGTGTLAELTVTPQITSGTITLDFRCSASESDDSNIMTIGGTNLLASDAQCDNNTAGSYTIGSGVSETAKTTTTTQPTSTTAPTSAVTNSANQPAQPSALPQSGAFDIIKWLTSGLALIGVGLLLL